MEDEERLSGVMSVRDSTQSRPRSPSTPRKQRGGSRERNTSHISRGRTFARHLARLLPILAFVSIWWALTALWFQQVRVYPTPPAVLDEITRIISGESPLGSTYTHAAATLLRLGTAFSVAFTFGCLMGIIAGRSKLAFDFMDNLVWIAMAVPSIVWVFIFLLALGITNFVPIVALSVLLTGPILITVAEGAKATPPELVTMARSYKVGVPQRLTALYIPHLVPYMASAARVAFALGIKVVIIAEVIGLPDGIGLLVKYWFDQVILAPVVAWGILLAIVGIAVDSLVFGPIEGYANRWSTSTARVNTASVPVGQ